MSTAGVFVIVGASLTGAKAAETLRAEGYEGGIVLIGEEHERPYERPPLSKEYLTGSSDRDSIFCHPPDWYEQNRVDLRLGTRATVLHRGAHEVELDTGERVAYDKALLATGSSPRQLRLPGMHASNVHLLRTVGDSERLRDTFARGGRVVDVGAGWIGLETAGAARGYGGEVTIIEPQSTPLHHVLGPELGEVFAALHRDNGADLRLGTGLAELRASGDTVAGVVTTDGQELPVDAVVVGVGIRPNSELAEAAGIAVENGVLTDESLRTSDPDVFAAGDVANSYNPLVGERVRVEHWANALNGGPAAARAMLGQSVVYDRVPYFFSDQYDLGMEYSGWAPYGSYDEVVFRGDRESREFVALWLRERRVLAGMNVNVWDVTAPIQALIRSGKPVDATRLADPDVSLDSLV